MPVTYTYSSDHIVWFTFVDPVTVHDVRNAIEAALADAAYAPDIKVISDRRAATAPDATFIREVAALARDRPELSVRHPVAIVVSSGDPAAYGMGRMQEMLAEAVHANMRTFYDLADAITWLKAQPSGGIV
jgi:precorrin-3B methylase